MFLLNTLNEQNTALLRRCYDKLPDSDPLDEIEYLIRAGMAFLFENRIEGKLVYVGVVKVCPAGLDCVVGAGIDGEADFDEIFNGLKWCARRLNKNTIRVTGRRGWRKHLSHRGFKVTATWKSINNITCHSFDYKLGETNET